MLNQIISLLIIPNNKHSKPSQDSFKQNTKKKNQQQLKLKSNFGTNRTNFHLNSKSIIAISAQCHKLKPLISLSKNSLSNKKFYLKPKFLHSITWSSQTKNSPRFDISTQSNQTKHQQQKYTQKTKKVHHDNITDLSTNLDYPQSSRSLSILYCPWSMTIMHNSPHNYHKQ